MIFRAIIAVTIVSVFAVVSLLLSDHMMNGKKK